MVSEYDYAFSTLTEKGIVTTAILLNDKSEDYPQMIHPLSRDGNAYYYAFNAAEEEGSEYLAAVGILPGRALPGYGARHCDELDRWK